MTRFRTHLAAALLALGCAAPALADEVPQGVPADGLEWAWSKDQPRRWFIDTQVVMPQYLFLSSDRNKQARMVAFRIQLAITCTLAGARTRRVEDVECLIDDVAILGAALSGDKGNLQPILEEMDTKLTGAVIQLGMRNDGRVVHLDVEGLEEETRTESRDASRTAEAMKAMIGRAMAGFDLQFPRDGATQLGYWPQYQATLMMVPGDHGTQGAIKMAHAVSRIEDHMVLIETASEGTITPSSDGVARNFYSTRLQAWGEFDTGLGLLQNRAWSAVGQPTASSAIAQGGAGVDYVQQGTLVFIPEGVEAPEVGETLEMDPPDERAESAILPQAPFNAGPG